LSSCREQAGSICFAPRLGSSRTGRRNRASFSRSFVAGVSEPLISCVAVWKQLRLNQRFTT
jgi:hypothetical protein